MAVKIRLGSRASPLAMAQARIVQSLLVAALGESAEHFPIESFTTTGDRIQDRRLLEAGGKGLFVKELDEALADRRIDAAVHSMKDLPTRLASSLVIACVPAREDARDAFICRSTSNLMNLPGGAVIGTASLRRQAQTLHLRPDLRVSPLRGSVQTRLQRLVDGTVDGTFLALAGLNRMGLADAAASLLSIDLMPPAAGQGALAVVCRSDDRATLSALAPLGNRDDTLATTAERAFLDALDGSCRTPIGANGRIENGTLNFVGEVLTPDGTKRWRRTGTVSLDHDPHGHADALGRQLAEDIKAEGGSAIRSMMASATHW